MLTSPMASVLAQTLRLKPGQYPISRFLVKTFQATAGASLINRENLSMGQLPRLAIVDSLAYTGYSEKNPFNFEGKICNFICLHQDSEPIPATAYTLNWMNGDVLREYLDLFHAGNLLGANSGSNISIVDYLNGDYCLYAFDLTPDNSDSAAHKSASRQGSLTLKMQFQPDTITVPCTAVVYFVFDNTIWIDQYRNVLTDYS